MHCQMSLMNYDRAERWAREEKSFLSWCRVGFLTWVACHERPLSLSKSSHANKDIIRPVWKAIYVYTERIILRKHVQNR